MATKNIIKMLFGVEGGARIDKGSGKAIKEKLEQIANQIKLKININTDHFGKQLDGLRSEIQKKLGGLDINLRTKGSPGSSVRAGTKTNEAEKEQLKIFRELKKELKEIFSEETKLIGLRRKGGAASLQQKKVERLTEAYYDKVEYVAEAGGIGKEHVELLREYADAHSEVLRIQQASADEQDKGQGVGHKGAQANARALIERYKDLGKHSKEAAATMHHLAKQAEEPLSTEPAKAADQTRKLAALTKDASAQLSKLSVETDTFGNKLKKSFSKKVIDTLTIAITGALARALSRVYQNVVQLDKAVTDLQIATGYTREETKALVAEYARMGRQLGAAATQVAESADTFLRQGYSIAEANGLIRDSLMLSKLGQIGSAEAAKVLTSAIKGYKVAIEDSTSIVDKFTAVDMVAAVSAGDLGKSMAETAVSANLAGVSLDKLIGYLAVVQETTQDGAESVGTFFKTLFARVGNVKAGKFIDDETGESLNDMEKVLSALGISLRDSGGQFRNFGTVLDEISKKWASYDSVQKRAIATAAAGTRQQEKFFVLFENYSKAAEYAQVSAGSAGTAEAKYEEAYLDSIEAKMQSLTASFQELSAALLDSSIVKVFLDIMNGVASALNGVAQFGDGLLVIIPTILLGFTALSAVLQKIWATASGAFPQMAQGIRNVITFTDQAVEKQKEKLRLIYEEETALLNAQKAVLEAEIQQVGRSEEEINLRKQKIELIDKELVASEHAHDQAEARVKKSGVSAAITAILTLLMTLNRAASGWGGTAQKVVGLITFVAGAFVAAMAIMKGAFIGTGIGAIIMAITTAVMGLVTAIKGFVGPSLQDLKDAAKESKEAFEETKNEIDGLNSKLKETKGRIVELSEIASKRKLSLVEEEELERLGSTNAALEQQLKLKEMLLTESKRQAQEDAVAVFNKARDEKINRAFVQEDNTFWNGVGRVFASVFSFGSSDWYPGGGYGISDWFKTIDKGDYLDSILANWDKTDKDGNRVVSDQQREFVDAHIRDLTEGLDALTYYT
ncbi:MAG: phage tail tape measure protein, partial [Bradymonadales bacterium]